MPITLTKMGRWPPAPCVEDEDDALANEYFPDGNVESFRSDNQGVVNRGSIDQYHIIMDANEPQEDEPTTAKKQSNQDFFVSDMSSSEDSGGPPTPPPVLGKETKKASGYVHAVNSSPPPVTMAAPAYRRGTEPASGQVEQQVPPRGRPQVTRIQTDVAGGDRQLPSSPYSFARTPTYHGTTFNQSQAPESLLSPSYAMATPRSLRIHQQQMPIATPRPAQPRTPQADYRSPNTAHVRVNSGTVDVRSGRREVPTIRYDTQAQAEPRTPRLGSDEYRRSFYEVPATSRTYIDSPQMSPAHSRRPSVTTGSGSSGEDVNNRYRPQRSRRSSAYSKNSPHTSSSTEESSRSYRQKNGRNSDEEQKKSRRGSSHRKERPILVDMGQDDTSRSIPNSAVDGGESVYYRREPRTPLQANPLTPVSGDASKNAFEDYFFEAFRQNDSRRSRQGPRTSGSVLVSPTASPPHTPRSEQQNMDYFDLTPTAQKSAQRSRHASVDEGQLRDGKHNSLLSVATAGAAMAARSSGTSSKPSGPPTEVVSASVSKSSSAPRSRRSSPVQEETGEAAKNPPYSPANQSQQIRVPVTPTYGSRPMSRGNSTFGDAGYGNIHPNANSHRTMSYSGTEYIQPWNGSYPASAVSSSDPKDETSAAHNNSQRGPPQSRSARTSISHAEFPLPTRTTVGLPICPRSQPTIGHRDWYTIKDNSHVDICPTCMSVVGSTKYRDFFVPSLPRPYNEASVCAMSKPWVRVAFLQSLRQNKPDLNYIRAVSSLPRDTKPCAGGKTDIRKWFHVIDPQTREPVPDFFACSACVCAIDNVFPEICAVFDRPKYKLNHERVCGMHTGSKHFQSIIDQLEQTTMKCRGRKWRSSDIESLVRHLRRVGRYRPCSRDEMQLSRGWHFMPDLPEFTICEECYDDVVWPVHERNVARDISKTLKSVPLRRGSDGSSGISCQLYSERMRRLFIEAVASRDFKPLHDAVLTRVAVQRRLIDQNRLFTEDMKYGIDRRQELERNKEVWRSFQ